ncbi:hypothetical protein BD289DRAFT_109238 [Coniella lustricola]|uniref:Uncharacterized protein n=1 Tax=Coniella lustricola TaxID=2025994 RepID=A0A2T2ZXF5_9PEZI|nr:hypothetical protein BD289DRAFT_109238 [Coniella lustricola]
MSYTDRSGGTLTLPSPNTIHHVDVVAAVRSLQRSLSRSPSKLSLTNSYCKNPDRTLSTPSSPSPCRIIQRPMPPASAPQLSHRYSPTSFSTPLRPVQLSLRSGKPKAASAKVVSHASRISPRRSPKRVLNTTADSGNMITSFSPPSLDALPGQEINNVLVDHILNASPTSRKSSEKSQTRQSLHSDAAGASKNTVSRSFDLKLEPLPTVSVSPLKRSDAFMSPIETRTGNPVPKRRSLHGVTNESTKATKIFEQHASKSTRIYDILEDKHRSQENVGDTDDSFFDDDIPASPTPFAMPRRSDSLRRSTLQQRQGEKPSLGRRQGEKHLAQMGVDAATPISRNRPRISLDQFVQPVLSRDSPFSNQAPLPNPSLHMLDRPIAQAQRHPLSRSLTTSSSNSSLPDDSPTHIPVQLDRPRAPHPFAKSMPLGARPLHDNANKNTATPAYKNAKPFQDAFKSTGLISKVNRNPELGHSIFGGSKAVMPDTPCKKPIYPSSTFPPSSGGGKGRHRHSFGSPSSPFSPAHNEEFPPTPTKSVFFKSIGNSKSVHDSPFVKTGSSIPTLASLSFRDVQHAADQCSLESTPKHSLTLMFFCVSFYFSFWNQNY